MHRLLMEDPGTARAALKLRSSAVGGGGFGQADLRAGR